MALSEKDSPTTSSSSAEGRDVPRSRPSPFSSARRSASTTSARKMGGLSRDGSENTGNTVIAGNAENAGDMGEKQHMAGRSLKRTTNTMGRSRNSSIQRFVLPSQQSQIPFEPSRTSTVSLATYQHMEDPLRYPRSDVHFVDRMITQLFGGFASRKSPWIHSAQNKSLIGLPIMRPDSLIVHTWSLIITLVDLTYTAFLVPLSIAFDTTKKGTNLSWLTITDIVGTTFYVVDVMMEFHTGFVAAYDIRRQLVMKRGFVAENYIRRGGFIIDLICILSIAPELAGALIPSAEGQTFKILFFFRLLRLLRVFRLLAGSSGVHFLVSPISGPILRVMNTATFFLLNVLFTMLVFINLLGCIWWFTAEIEGLEKSWVATAGVNFNVANASAASQYVTSVYFAMAVITTVGFGDITPVTVAEMLVAMLFMGIGLFYFGYIVSAVSSLVTMLNTQARGTQMVREKLEDIDVWAAARHIPSHLRQQVKTYYLEVWAPHCGVRLDDASKFHELPAALRAELVLSLSGEALRQSYMLSALDVDLMEFLATLGLPFPLIAGHDLYTEGEPAEKFWVLQEGELTVMRGIQKIGVIVGPAVIGQAAIFAKLLDDCRNRMHTMRAEVNCTLWEFSGGTFSHMLQYRPKVLVRLCLRYRDHLMHLQNKFGKQAPRRIHRLIERLGLIAHAITNEEPFIGAEGVEIHIRDPESVGGREEDSSIAEEGDSRRAVSTSDASIGSRKREGDSSPVREEKHSFSSTLHDTRRLERMPTIIAAARAFAGEPDWDDWEPEEGFIDSGSPREEFPELDDALESGLNGQMSGVVSFTPAHEHSRYDI